MHRRISMDCIKSTYWFVADVFLLNKFYFYFSSKFVRTFLVLLFFFKKSHLITCSIEKLYLQTEIMIIFKFIQ